MIDGHPRRPVQYPAYVALLAAAIVLLLTATATINWATDPLQVFRRSTWHSPHFSENQRYQAPGLARHYAEPIVMVGTSHMENMLPSMVSSILGKPALNLAISGSSLREQQLALGLALKTGKVERVLWGIDYSALTWGDILVEEWGEFPDYLYRFDARLVSRYLLSLQTLRDSIASVREPPPVTLERRNTWWHRHTFSRDRVLAAWREQAKDFTPELRKELDTKLAWPIYRNVLERRLFATIRRHPGVHFDLILPPYSMLNYASDFRIHDEYFFQRLLMRAALREFAAGQPNVGLWDFQTDVEVAGNLDNYKDLEHYGLPINQRMLNRIAANAPIPGDGFPERVRDYLRQICAAEGNAPTELCPYEVRCGLHRLDGWLQRGAAGDDLLAAAHTPCP